MTAGLLGQVLIMTILSGTVVESEKIRSHFPALELVQRKPYDRGNCFYWKGCRGDSIGAMWILSPCYCGILGGKSWMSEDNVCHDLPDGPWRTQGL